MTATVPKLRRLVESGSGTTSFDGVTLRVAIVSTGDLAAVLDVAEAFAAVRPRLYGLDGDLDAALDRWRTLTGDDTPEIEGAPTP